jgi:hypothetical protein
VSLRRPNAPIVDLEPALVVGGDDVVELGPVHGPTVSGKSGEQIVDGDPTRRVKAHADRVGTVA